MRIEGKSKIIKELIPFIIITAIALSVIPIVEVWIPNNSAKYLYEASELHGQGLRTLSHNALIFRRPLYPMILASGFRLWGKRVHSASLATRIFFGLDIILIYILGRIFFNMTVGLLSSCLVLTSHGINLISVYINSDIVLPFFILLFTLFFYVSLNRSSRIWAVFAGVSLGMALMVKETAFICLGLPIGIILLAPKEKKWEFTKLSLWVLGALIVPVIITATFMFFANKSFVSMLEWAYKSSTYRMRPFSDWLYLFTVGFPKTIFKYYQDLLKPITPLSFLMIFSCFFISIRGFVQKKTSDLILIILIVISLPLVLQIADEGDRPGQTTIVYLILYITLAVFVVSCISLLMNYIVKFNNKFIKLNIFDSPNKICIVAIHILLIISAGFFLIKAQLFNKNYPTWSEWKYGHSLAILTKQPFTVYGRFTTEQKDAAEWLKKNAVNNSKIIADGFTHEALDFFDVADYVIPVFRPKRGTPIGSISINKRDDKAIPLYLITYSSFDNGMQRNRIVFPIFEEDILATLKNSNPDYLVLSGRGLFFSEYFNRAKWANLRFSNQNVRIFRIHLDRFEPITFDYVGVNDSINKHLFWLKKNHPDEYKLLKVKIELLGLAIDELKNSHLRFAPGEVY